MTDRDFWIAVRAAKIREAKLLEQQRSCLMEEIAAIEQRWQITPRETTRQVRIADSDTIATAAMVESRV